MTVQQRGENGIETVLALAAASEAFAGALSRHREATLAACAVELTGAERSALCAVDAATLGQMIAAVAPRLQARERRVFLRQATSALAGLAAGAGVLSLHGCKKKPTAKESSEDRIREARLRRARRLKGRQGPRPQPQPQPQSQPQSQPQAAPGDPAPEPGSTTPGSPGATATPPASDPQASQPRPRPRPRPRPVEIKPRLDRSLHVLTGVRPDRPDPLDLPSDRPLRPGIREIRQAIDKIMSSAKGCYNRYRVKGSGKVRVVLSGRTGRPTSVSVTGRFARTPTGRCVTRAFRRMRVKRFRAASASFVFPIKF